MLARRALAALGAAALATVLTGCLDLSGEISISDRATITGQQRIEMNKQVVGAMGVSDLAGFEALLNGDAELFGMSSEPEATETEFDDDCPDLSVEESSTSYVAICTYDDYTPTGDDDFSVAIVDGQVQFTFEQTGTEGFGGDASTGDAATSGSIDLVVNFPGPISSVTGTTSTKATRVDSDTIRISGTALESYDVVVTSSTTGGTNGAPSLGAIPQQVDPGTGGGTDIQGLENVDDGESSTPWAAITAGLVVLALIAAAVTALLVRRGRATAPATAGVAATGAADQGQAATGGTQATAAGATAAPGWYPFPGDPTGQPRYWDGTSWSDPTT